MKLGASEGAPKPKIEGQPKGTSSEKRVDVKAKGMGGFLRSARNRQVSPQRVLTSLSTNSENVAKAAELAQPESPSITPAPAEVASSPMQFGIKDKAGDYNPIPSAEQLNKSMAARATEAPVPPKVIASEVSPVTPVPTPDAPAPQTPPDAAPQSTSGEKMAQVVQSMTLPDSAPRNILQPSTAPTEAEIQAVTHAREVRAQRDQEVPTTSLEAAATPPPPAGETMAQVAAPFTRPDATPSLLQSPSPAEGDASEGREAPQPTGTVVSASETGRAVVPSSEIISAEPPPPHLDTDQAADTSRDTREPSEATFTVQDTGEPQQITPLGLRIARKMDQGLNATRDKLGQAKNNAWQRINAARERRAAQRETAKADADALSKRNEEATPYFNFFRKAAEQARAETKPIPTPPSTPDITPSASPASPTTAEVTPPPASKPEVAVTPTAPPSSEDPSNNLSEDEIADLAAVRTKYEGEIAANKAGNAAASPDRQTPGDSDTPQAVIDTVLSAANASPGSAENKRLTSADYADAMASQLQNYSRENSLVGKFKSWREARQQARKDKQQQIAKDFFDTAMAAKRAKGEIPEAKTPASTPSPEGPADNPYNLQLQHIEDNPVASSTPDKPSESSTTTDPEVDAADALLAEARKGARDEAIKGTPESNGETNLSPEAQTLFDSLNQQFSQIDAETARLIKEGKLSEVDANVASLRKKREATMITTEGKSMIALKELSGKNDYFEEAAEYWEADAKFDQDNKAAKTNEEGDTLLAKTLQADFAREQRFLKQRIEQLKKDKPEDLASKYTDAQTKELHDLAAHYANAGMLEQSVLEQMKGSDPILDAAIEAKFASERKAEQDARTKARQAATRPEATSTTTAERTSDTTATSSTEATSAKPAKGETESTERQTVAQAIEAIKNSELLKNASDEVKTAVKTLVEAAAKDAGISLDDNVEEKVKEENQDEETKKKRNLLLTILQALALVAVSVAAAPAAAGVVGGVAAVNASTKIGGQ